MVRETQPVITVFQVPLRHMFGRCVAIAVSRMSVKVALEPLFVLPWSESYKLCKNAALTRPTTRPSHGDSDFAEYRPPPVLNRSGGFQNPPGRRPSDTALYSSRRTAFTRHSVILKTTPRPVGQPSSTQCHFEPQNVIPSEAEESKPADGSRGAPVSYAPILHSPQSSFRT